jgi:hypothetical protein
LSDGYSEAGKTLDDKTIFYIRSAFGELSTKLDTRENPEASCRRKKISEGIKKALRDN